MSTHDHPALLPDDVLLRDVDETRRRASGPGGQHRNKSWTGVRLVHRPTGLSADGTERRSQGENRRAALRRLRLRLALSHREPLDDGHPLPSALWRRRVVAGGNLGVGERHPDVPALLAEALDVLAATDDDVALAAERLNVTTSRLLRLLRLVPRALADLNQRLGEAGRRTWR